MPDDQAAWQRLIQGPRAGDQEVVWEVHDSHLAVQVRLAARNLESRTWRRFDAVEIARPAMHTFLRRCAGGDIELDSCGGLWQLLCASTLKGVREQVRSSRSCQRQETRRSARPSSSASSSRSNCPGGVSRVRKEES